MMAITYWLMPFTVLKIDQTFITDINDDKYDEKIVTSVIAMAHALGMEVTAEGVETEAQYNLLKELSCDHVQGYLLSQPIDAESITDLLKKNSKELLSA